MPERIVNSTLSKPASRTLSWFPVLTALFIYLNLFILPWTPIWVFGDNSVYLLNATRMLDGQVMYRDFSHFVPPGTELVYILFLKVLGARAFVPNLILIAVGTSLAWVITKISAKILSQTMTYLPALIFLTFEYRRAFDGLHHWLSLLAIMVALLVLIDSRNTARLALCGVLCGVSSCFTQTYGVAAIFGLALFLLWESRERKYTWSKLLDLEAWLILPFLGFIIIATTYFSWDVGFARYFESTVIFLARFYPRDIRWNTFRVYMSEPPIFLPLYRLPALGVYLFIDAALPLTYIVFIIRYARQHHFQEESVWTKLVLLNFVGLALLASVSPAPDWDRMCAVSLPSLIVLAWFLDEPTSIFMVLERLLWLAVILLAIAEPIERQAHWHGSLNLPAGKAAFLTSDEFSKFDWFRERTRPTEYVFEGNLPDIYYLLRLRNPAKVSFLTPTGYTRPEEVRETIKALEKNRVRFVIWKVDLDMPYENNSAADSLGPLRDYLQANYRTVKTFSEEQIWERVPQTLTHHSIW